jgi:hypothetical protein
MHAVKTYQHVDIILEHPAQAGFVSPGNGLDPGYFFFVLDT